MRGSELWLRATIKTVLVFAAGVLQAVAAATPAGAAQPASTPPALPAELRTKVETLLRASPVRGAAVVLVDVNGPTGALWYGQADAIGSVPMTPATCLRAGSVSKTFTALLAMRLADRGQLQLDDPLPADLQPPAPAACRQRVTMAQLLEHTGGVTGSSHADYGKQVANAPVQAVARDVVQRPLAWCPGLHYSYSNDGITLAAAALERAGGADFDMLMQREVFAPLGITNASFATEGLPACLSRSYDADGKEITQPWQLPVRPAGALVATPLELARAVQMFIGYGSGPNGHVLEPCSLAHMAVSGSGLAARHGAAAGAYGRGLFRYVAAGRLMVGHWGRIDGFQTTIGFAPETGRGMVVMVNTADRNTMNQLRDLVAEEVWRGVPAPPLPPLATPATGISGWYANASHDMPLRAPWVAMLDVVRIEQDATGLLLRGLWPSAASRRVMAVSEASFREENLPLPSMAFARDMAGDQQGARWWVDGESYREVRPWQAVLKLAALLLGLMASAGLVVRASVVIGKYGLQRLRRTPRSTSPAQPAYRWLTLSAVAWLLLFGGYLAFGVLSVGDSLASLGRPSPTSLGLATASAVAPIAAGIAAWTLRRTRDVAAWGMTLSLLSLSVLSALNGWLPLVTWAP